MADVNTGQIVEWNPAAEQLFGYSAGEALELPLKSLVPERLKARHTTGVARYRQTGRGRLIEAGRPFEVPAVRKDGVERTVELTLSPLEDASVGRRLVLAIIRDITERKEEEQTARHLATIVESSEDAIIGVSLDSRITSWNAGAERLYGYAAQEVAGKPLSLLIPPDRLDELPGILRRVRQGERIQHYETQRVRKDGTRVDVSLSISPVRDASGQIVGAANIARDITELKRAEEQRLQLAREQADRAAAEAAAERLRHLQSITEAALAHLTLGDLLAELVGRVRDLLAADTAAVLLPDGDSLLVRAAAGEEELEQGTRLPRDRGLCGRVATERRVVSLEDVDQDDILSPLLREKGVKSLLGAPLLVEGRVLGTMHVGTLVRRCWSAGDAELLQLVADRVALALERARLYEIEQAARAAAEEGRRRAALLAEASRAFAEAGPDVSAVLEAVARRLAETLGDTCAVMLLSDSGRRLEPAALHDRDPEQLALARTFLAARPLRVGEGPSGRVAQTGQPLLLPSVSPDEWRPRLRPEQFALLERFAPRSLMAAPLRAGGHVIGTLSMLRRAGSPPFTEHDLALLEELADRTALAVENARLYGALSERERQLQDLVGRLIAAQEEERRRVAYELHDGLAQTAAGTHLHLRGFARRHQPHVPAEREELERAVELAQRTVREARTVVAALRPTALDDLGIAAALQAELEELQKQGWQVEFEARLGSERLDPAVETALFRVAQEALRNASKHAQTTRARVLLRRTRHGVRLEVQDWGRGFRPATAQAGAGPGERVGLSGMRERVMLLGGRCEIRSRPGAGTQIVAEVPLRAR